VGDIVRSKPRIIILFTLIFVALGSFVPMYGLMTAFQFSFYSDATHSTLVGQVSRCCDGTYHKWGVETNYSVNFQCDCDTNPDCADFDFGCS
jgi:hypothetical protein